MSSFVNHRFVLSDSTKSYLKTLDSPFPTAVGEIVYYRTYSRLKKDGSQEHWADTVIRVTEGIISVRKDYYLKHNLGWNDQEWQKYAKEFSEYMFNMKFLPPGRGLWAMGTDYMYERGSAALNNCGACTCKDLVLGATWTMDMLMCGVGVGAAVDWEGEVITPNKTKFTHHVVADSREGWVNSFKHLLQAYIPDSSSNTKKFPKFDYSKVRKKGEKISGFGGTASGPGPLQDLHFRVSWYLDTYIKYQETHNCECVAEMYKAFYEKGFYMGLPEEVFEKNYKLIKYSKQIKYDKTRCCADIINAIGVCVVAGNVRRCIAKGSKVLTKDNSFKNIENIEIGDNVLTDNGWKPVVNTLNQGIQHVVKVTHQDGYIECTPNHRIAVFNNINGSYDWKYARDIKDGDVLGFPIKDSNNKSVTVNNETNAKLPPFEYSKPLHSTTCTDIKIPSLDDKMAWLIGCFQGDGYVNLGKNVGEVNIAIHGDDVNQLELVKEQFERFGVNINMTNPKDTDYSYKVRVSSKQLAMYFYKNIKQPKVSLKIPEFIKMSNNKIKAAFIQGLMDADGCVKSRPIIVVTTVYENYAKEVQALLLSMGIISRYNFRPVETENWQDKHEIVLINKRDKRLFLELTDGVGFKKFTTDKRASYTNRWPQNMITFDHNNPQPIGWRKKVASKAKWVPIDTLKDHFNIEGRFIPVLVESVVTSFKKVETYDIEVQDNHNFVCQNVLVHNSAEIALGDPGDETFLNLKNYERDPSRSDIGWMSNNSVRLNQTWQFSEFIPNIAERIRNNGEPGIINLKNIEKYGRFGKEAGTRGIIEDRGTLSNPCVTGDTEVLTDEGYVQVSELVGRKFTCLMDGDEFDSTDDGFWSNGIKPVYEVKLQNDCSIKVTENHKLLNINDEWVETKNLKVGDCLKLHDIGRYCPGTLSVMDPSDRAIVSIDLIGDFEVYDCSVPGPNRYVTAGGFYSHNCGEIPLESFELCLSGSTRILTGDGYKEIKDLCGKNIKVASCYDSDVNLNMVTSFQDANVFPSGIKQIFTLTTVDGRTIKSTGNHPFLVYKDKKLLWVKTSDIKIKDKLISGLAEIDKKPPKLDSKYYALGHYLGDGWFLRNKDGRGQMGICAVGHEMDLMEGLLPVWESLIVEAEEYIKSSYDNRYNTKLKIMEDKNGVLTISISKPHLFRMLENKYGFVPGKAPTKRFPKCYWTANPDQKRSFIRGLIDADGSVIETPRRSVSFTSANRELSKDLIVALSEFGIQSRITTHYVKSRDRYQTILQVRGPDMMDMMEKHILFKNNTHPSVKSVKLERINRERGSMRRRTNRYCTVKSIEPGNYEPVYNIEVPKTRNYIAESLVVHNCNLSECFPSRCLKPRDSDPNDCYFDEDEFLKALEFATFYTSTVSLLPTQWEVTNKVIARNRRIGVSLSGIADVYDRIGHTHLTRILRSGYSHVREINENLAQDAGVRSSIRVTTVKPSGSISQLAGVSSGMHFPTFKYAIRRIMVSDTSPICKVLMDNNVPYENSVYTPGTYVFSFPIDQGKTRAATNVSMWEQFALLATLQREWSDNMVSCTIYFQPESEGPHIEHALAQFIPLIKSVSMLPHTEAGVYAQAPYEGISQEEYETLSSKMKKIDWSNYGGTDGEMPKYCTNGECELPAK